MPAPRPASGRATRLGVLDGLRFLAALGVVAFHFTGITPAWDGRAPEEIAPLARWAAYGSLGVPLFFVISGFVVLMTAWGRDVPHFVASRVGRLFPAYWAAVVIAMVFAFVLWPAGAVLNGQPPSKSDALVNLTMLQGALGVRDLNGAFWTLWTEARFYLLIALLVLVGMTRRRVLAFAALWPVAGALAEQSDQQLLSTLLIADYAPYFAGGMLLYVLHRDGHDLGTWLLVGLQSLLALRFAMGEYPVSLPLATGWAVSGPVIAAASFACFGLVALATLTRLNRRGAGWLTALGALTYPVYLVHQQVGLYVVHLLHGRTSAWAVLAAALAPSLADAAVLHVLVERPCGLRLRTAVLASMRRTDPVTPPAPAAPESAGPPVPARPRAFSDVTVVRQAPSRPPARVPAPSAARE